MAKGPFPDLEDPLIFLAADELFWKRSEPLPVRCWLDFRLCWFLENWCRSARPFGSELTMSCRVAEFDSRLGLVKFSGGREY
jgi:hypothetical protein